MSDQDLRKPLTETELDQLDDFLARVEGGLIANVEALDGFLTAVAVCPELVMPSEFMKVVQSGAVEDGDMVFEGMDEVEFFFNLVMRQWNTINSTLREGEFHMPVLMPVEDGRTHGNDWAAGFIEGTKLRLPLWRPIMEDEERAGPFLPIFALAYEHHPDPDMRPLTEPLTDEQREHLLATMVAGVKYLYDAFRDDSTMSPNDGATPSGLGRAGRKVGRNEPCPCGSGRKFKKCCGGVTVH